MHLAGFDGKINQPLSLSSCVEETIYMIKQLKPLDQLVQHLVMKKKKIAKDIAETAQYIASLTTLARLTQELC